MHVSWSKLHIGCWTICACVAEWNICGKKDFKPVWFVFSFCKDHGNISGTKSNYTNQTSLKQFWFSVPLKLRNLYHTDLIDLAAQPHSSICCDLCIIKPNTFTSHLSIFDQGTWWYKSIQYSCEQILLNTTQLYIHFFLKTPAMQSKRMYTQFVILWKRRTTQQILCSKDFFK